jgi:Protein of unknown function (DUF4087)
MIKKIIFSLGVFALSTSAVFANETRCGWLNNPTPANWWLTDRDGRWIIGTQGGFQADGIDTIKFYQGEKAQRESVLPNRNYGYYCACMEVVTSKKRQQILEILGGKQIPLKTCRQDPALPSQL